MFKELEVSGAGILSLLIILTIITSGLIYYFKRKYNSYTVDSLKDANKGTKSSTASSRVKFPEVDIYKNSSSFFNFGMLASILISLAFMGWTSFQKVIKVEFPEMVFYDEMEIEIPRIANQSPPPPPPPPLIEEVPNTEVIEDNVIFNSNEITQEIPVEAPVELKKQSPPVPPPPPKKAEPEEIFKIVEQMPRFPGCEDKGTDKEKDECAKTLMLQYIYNTLKYPAIARENGVEGQVVLQFVVDREGKITETKIMRDIGAGCGAAAESVVLGMNDMPQRWTPGKQRGRPVKVLYTLPVKFKLEG
ncbi:MAG: energy transducer TonB [Lewinellaceae bacterium]|nr:energy transducer TonB [Lewinellaceae bacterium]